MVASVKKQLLRLRDQQTQFLFGVLGPHLKVGTAILEYRHLLKKHRRAIEAGEMTQRDVAKIAAEIANADFGGLHLQRLGRRPTIQHLMRLALLAPDWTESNVRTKVHAIAGGSKARRKAFRTFWTRTGIRALGSIIVLQMMLAGLDDKDFLWRLQRAWKEGKLRWLDLDITPLYRALGGTDEKRKYFSLLGHFRDPLKFIVRPGPSAKHKSSVLGRFDLDFATGTDWLGRPFTTLSELLGIDDKGVYKTHRDGEWDVGDPKGGKLKGRLVRKSGRMHVVEYEQLPSYVLYEARSSMPIPVQAALSALAGEIDGFDAVLRSAGAHEFTTYPGTPERSLKTAVETGDEKAAQAALQRLGMESAGDDPKAIAKAKNKYLGNLVYRLPQNPENVKTLKILGITTGKALALLRQDWIRRGNKVGSKQYDKRFYQILGLMRQRG